MTTYVGVMNFGDALHSGDNMTSPDGRCNLIMQGDGNLVLYSPTGGVLWVTGFGAGGYCVFQGDGNLVFYNSGGGVLGASNTDGRGVKFIATDTGVLQILNAAGAVIWQVGSGGVVPVPTGGWPSFRYYRLNWQGNGQYNRVYEWMMMAVIGGGHVAGTYSASDVADPLSLAFDGNDGTAYASQDSGNPHWILIDYGSAQEIREVAIHTSFGGWIISGSNNGSDWTQLLTFAEHGMNNISKRFVLTATRWKARFTSGGGYLRIGEMQMTAAGGQKMLTQTSQVTADRGQNSGQGYESVENLIDGDYGTWFTFENTPVNIVFAPLTSAAPMQFGFGPANGYGMPSDYTLFKSIDYGATYILVMTKTGVPYTGGQMTMYDITPPPPLLVKASEMATMVVAKVRTLNILASQFYNMTAIRLRTIATRASQMRVITINKTVNQMRLAQELLLVAVKGRVKDFTMRAWWFTMDGHDFYVLHLGEGGTLVYDMLTQQWVDWQSRFSEVPGFTNWRANVGTNWVSKYGQQFNSDIVAGDDTMGTIWYLNPEQGYDNSPYNGDATHYRFTRRITGGAPMRGRATQAVNLAYLTASLGAPVLNSYVKLETSDDSGKSWDDHGLITVTPAGWDQELQWPSLGLMQAPGRIFRITDDGAVARIDGLDIE